MKEKDSMKMNRKMFIHYVADKNGVSYRTAEAAYYMIMDGIVDAVIDGFRVCLVGIGSFYSRNHKGHPIQFEQGGQAVSDYPIFRFTPSSLLNKRLRAKKEGTET